MNKSNELFIAKTIELLIVECEGLVCDQRIYKKVVGVIDDYRSSLDIDVFMYGIRRYVLANGIATATIQRLYNILIEHRSA